MKIKLSYTQEVPLNYKGKEYTISIEEVEEMIKDKRNDTVCFILTEVDT